MEEKGAIRSTASQTQQLLDKITNHITQSGNSSGHLLNADSKSEEKISSCCVCCKIISAQGDKQHSPDSQSPVCSSLCLRVVDQTMAFMQGFVLCKMICDFLSQHVARAEGIESHLDGSRMLLCEMNVPRFSVSTAKTEIEAFPEALTDISVGKLTYTLAEKAVHSVVESDHRAQVRRTSKRSTPSATKGFQVSAKPRTQSKSKPKIRKYAKNSTAVLKLVKNVTDGSSSGEYDTTSLPLDADSCSDSDVPENEDDLATVSVNDVPSSESEMKSYNRRKLHVDSLDKVSCEECGKEFKNKRSLKYHLIRHHGRQINAKKKMACRFCGKVCIGQTGLTLHIGNRHSGEKAVECDICGERFSTSHRLHRHKTMDHNKPHGQCHICGKHFKYAHTLKEHLRAHSGIKGFVCELCGQSFFRLSNLCDHRRRNHGGGRRTKNCDGSETTPIRKGRPKTLNTLQCRECLEILPNLKAWEAHREEHKLNRSIFCPTCGKGFRTHSSLYSHQKQHQEKKFQCDICSKTFTYKCNMERHKETHNTERPHKCEYCHKAFKTAIVMNRHKVMHIEEKQYKCHICGRGLTCTDNLKKHLKVMHPGSYPV